MSLFDFFNSKADAVSTEGRERRNLVRNMLEKLRQNTRKELEQWPEYGEELLAFQSAVEQTVTKRVQQSRPIRPKPTLKSLPVLGQKDKQEEMPEPPPPPPPPVDASLLCRVTRDRMAAFACIIPPLNGGAAITREKFHEDLHYEGLTFGLDERAVNRLLSPDYLHICLIARGTLPEDGKDGSVEELFERTVGRKLDLGEGEKTIDFSNNQMVQPIRKGEPICRITLPTQGTEGRDVSGQVFHGKPGAPVEVPVGENTQMSEDGTALVAKIDGVVATVHDHFVVRRQDVVMGDVDHTIGHIQCSGDLYIGGDVLEDVNIQAAGNIIIAGAVLGGQITAGGTIRVQKGVRCDQLPVALEAGQQLQCAVIENATAAAGQSIYAETIVNSSVTSREGSIYVLSGRGLILGGELRASKSIFAKKIGNLSGVVNKIMVGYRPGLSERLKEEEGSLTEVRETLEKLRKNIATMRMAGSTLSLEKREVLSQLVEQRKLYEAKEEELSKSVKDLKKDVQAASTGKISCEELYPVTEVTIGDRSETFQMAETRCDIHIFAGKVVVK